MIQTVKTIREKQTRYGPQAVRIVKETDGRLSVQVEVNYPRVHVDWPIQYEDGRIAYDFAERVPVYLKRYVAIAFDELKRMKK